MTEPLKATVNGLPFDMLPVHGGTFMMGSPDGDEDARNDEKPEHLVRVSDFYIGKYPVTQALWEAVMDGNNPPRFQDDDRPVESVSWDDAQAFVQALNQITRGKRLEGYHYRLPTEAEWEYAARGGQYHAESYKYAGSDRLKDVGWFEENSGYETNTVGLKNPNQLGLYDISGNVREWCEDWYGGTEYYQNCKSKEPVENPTGPKSGGSRVLRGGGWFSDAQDCRAAHRYSYWPGYRSSRFGFRLVLACN
jgi:formylglycine-generating enzyme required for sulfatase activity